MIRTVVKAAERGGAELSICGEMAADPRCAPLLAGLGLRRFSISPGMITEVKGAIRQATLAEWSEVARRCLELSTAEEVIDFLDRVAANVPSPVGGP